MSARLIEGRRLEWEASRAAIAWLAKAREAAGPNSRALADLLGVSPAWVRLRESGSTRMSAEEVAWIAGVVGVPVPELTGEDGQR